MLKISEFSRLAQVPAKTLRYYDDIGLFQPAVTDRFTGYRYYSVEQLPRLNRILALKALGLSLEEVAHLLENDLTADEMRGMLRLKQAETRQRLEEEQRRLAAVEARLRQIEAEGRLSDYEVVVKTVAPLRVAAVRAQSPDLDAIGGVINGLLGRLFAHLGQHRVAPVGPSLTLYHNTEFVETGIDLEAAVPVGADVPAGEGITVYTLPAVERMACVVHRGSYADLGVAYSAMLAWLEGSGGTVGTPNRELYLQHMPDPAGHVTEIQYPLLRPG